MPKAIYEYGQLLAFIELGLRAEGRRDHEFRLETQNENGAWRPARSLRLVVDLPLENANKKA